MRFITTKCSSLEKFPAAAATRATSLVVAAFIVALNAWAQQGIPAGMRLEPIADPVLNMTAFNVQVPSNWHFAGRLLQGSSCSPVPFPVFRVTSPDGLTLLERLPSLDWSWGTGPNAAPKNDCLPLNRNMSANEFAKYIALMLQTEYVAEDPYPADVLATANKAWAGSSAANAARYRAAGMNAPETYTDSTRAIVRFTNGSFKMKGRIAVAISCNANRSRPIGNRPLVESHTCSATVRYEHAPEAQFEAMVKLLSNAGGIQNPQWTTAWIEQSKRQTARNINQIQQAGAAAIQQSKASHEQYMQSQASRQRTHEAFLDTMKRGTNMSMNRTAQATQARSTAASNVVDYALDQQTVRDPKSGQVNKVSSRYSYTWVDSSGKTSYQTQDPNANPNGSLPGNWSRQQVVNGNGSQK